MRDFPSNDRLLQEVLATLQEHPSGLDKMALIEAVAVRTGHEELLSGSKEDRKVVVVGVRFCVEILVREKLAATKKAHVRATPAGLNAGPERVDDAWNNELARDGWIERALNRAFENLADNV